MPDVKQFKCPSCGAPIAYDASSGEVRCGNCGNRYAVSALETLENGDRGFDWSQYIHHGPHETLENTRVYKCQSCGAEIEADMTTAATKCPYCDNNVVLTDKVSGSLKPNAIIPFRITQKDLPDVVKQFYKGKKLLPSSFLSEKRLREIKGIYVPFWLFDCTLDGNMVLNGTRTRSYREGDYDCVETSYFLLEREGDMRFAKVPVDASVKMPNDLMDSLEPFDYSELVDFNSAYLSGYLADRFDSDPDAELPRADERMMTSACSILEGTARGYSGVSIRANGMRITDADVKYVLLPVYLMNYEYQGKMYRFAVNGQTGKVVGDLPISKGKSAAWFAGVGAAAAAAVFALTMYIFNFL